MAAKEAILAISFEATQEGTLEDALERVSLRWTSIDLPIVAYKDNKDVFVLGCLDDLTAPLDDSLVTVSTILSSRCFPRLPYCVLLSACCTALAVRAVQSLLRLLYVYCCTVLAVLAVQFLLCLPYSPSCACCRALAVLAVQSWLCLLYSPCCACCTVLAVPAVQSLL